MSFPILELKNISKNFFETKALTDVNFSLSRGEVHAVLGENGAGKSTLVNVICGIHQANRGEIYVEGIKRDIKNPKDAQDLGIRVVHQEIALCPDLTVAENIFIEEINNSKKLLINYPSLYERALEIMSFFEADIDVKEKVSNLTISEQQIIEIARSLSSDASIIIFDEPTTSLTAVESSNLFTMINDLRSRDISIIYISHKMQEIFEICDRATVLRDGQYIGTYEIPKVDERLLVNKMIGREIEDLYPEKSNDIQEVLFEVVGISDGSQFSNLSFELRKGEILGFAGLVGAGRSELAKVVCGIDPKSAGEIYLNGKQIEIRNYTDAIRNGIVYLTENRKEEGLFLERSIKENISVLDLKKVSKRHLIDRTKEKRLALEYLRKLNVRARDAEQEVLNLSGGNQQKVLIAKLLNVAPQIVFMDEPTKGIDVGAKVEIHRLLRDLAEQGIGVILISSELPEIIGLCDRVICMYGGEIRGEVRTPELCEENVMYYCAGLRAEA